MSKALRFAIVVDESRDVSKTEQLSIVIRYYLEGTIYERSLGFELAKALDAKSLFHLIEKRLKMSSIDISRCVAQTYDGACVMSGCLNGAQKIFRDVVPKAVYVHFYDHRLNLILIDVCKNLDIGREFFDLLELL